MIFSIVVPPNSPRSFVLDVSVAAAWGIPPRYSVYAHRVRSRLASGAWAIVTANWPLDLIAEFLVAVYRGETTAQRTDTILADLAAYHISLDVQAPHRAWPEILDLARGHNLPARDAAYLELALRPNLPLATTDATLLRAAPAAGVAVFTP